VESEYVESEYVESEYVESEYVESGSFTPPCTIPSGNLPYLQPYISGGESVKACSRICDGWWDNRQAMIWPHSTHIIYAGCPGRVWNDLRKSVLESKSIGGVLQEKSK
jgi:hypothetical protein